MTALSEDFGNIIWNIIYRGKNPRFFRKGSVESMIFLKLHRKVPAQTQRANGEKTKDPVRKIPSKVKIMTLLKMTKQVKKEIEKLTIQCRFNAKEGKRVTSQIRIHIEETKRKVRECSPAALRFIGPGDQIATLMMRGGIRNYHQQPKLNTICTTL
jgi:hypothetical protein